MRNLRYIMVQPAIDYYLWQVEVVIHNFMKHGVNPNNIDVVCSYPKGETVPLAWRHMANTYNTVRFFFYEDTRESPCYTSSIRPHLLSKHWETHPELEQEAIFYHDCDIIFTRPPMPVLEKYLDDDVWYGSDTEFYVSAEYIESKEMGLYKKMCQIVNIDPAIPRKNQKNTIGAQYIMKNVKKEYWDKIYKDCETEYQYFLDHLKVHPDETETFYDYPKYNSLQKWCADLYTVLWNAWYFKFETKAVEDLEFTWATQEKVQFDKNLIFHNAGVVLGDSGSDKFYKGHFVGHLPYNLNPEEFVEASKEYVKEIVETGKTSCLYEYVKVKELPTTEAPTTIISV